MQHNDVCHKKQEAEQKNQVVRVGVRQIQVRCREPAQLLAQVGPLSTGAIPAQHSSEARPSKPKDHKYSKVQRREPTRQQFWWGQCENNQLKSHGVLPGLPRKAGVNTTAQSTAFSPIGGDSSHPGPFVFTQQLAAGFLL